MAWKESTLMSSRLEFILLTQKAGANISAICEQFGISRKTGHKWIARYAADGESGLQDKSRRPHTSPTMSASKLEQMIIELHLRYPYWGARKLYDLLPTSGYRPHHSTIDAILHRNGLQVEGAPTIVNKAPIRFEHEAPNLLWQMDFKGHFALTDRAAGRCHPLTILDDYSRFSLCLAACPNEQFLTVQSALRATFERYGLPRRITADNGPPWGGSSGLTQLAVWLIQIGVIMSHSRPYHPQTQGKDERFHRTLKLELLERHGFSSIAGCQQAFDDWRTQYNLVRPHHALGGERPISRYETSNRAFQATLPPVEYDFDDIVRKVNRHGYISYKARQIYLGEGLRSQPVAIRPTATDGVLDVYFCHHNVRQINLHESALQ